jgi:crossover junction endodeoxyribonuclease RuvC
VVEESGASRVRHLAHGVLALDERQPLELRLVALYRGLCEQIERHRPGCVAVEDVFHAQSVRSALVLGQARGVALLAAAQSGAEVRSFAPSVVKQAVTGSGRAEKAQVARMVDSLLGIQVALRADASDALAVALCGLLRHQVARPVERPGRETAADELHRLLAAAKAGGTVGGNRMRRRGAARGKG